MADVMTPEQRSYCMSRIKGKDTKMEVVVRSELYKRGYRFRKNYSKLPGKPDIVFTKQKAVLFLDGNFWHGYRFPAWKGRLSKFWLNKIENNRERDKRNFAKLKRKGWKVLRIWEHEVLKEFDKTMDRIITFIEYNNMDMGNNIIKIKKEVERECKTNKELPQWFYSDHLLMVERNSIWLLKQQPKADKEIVLLGVWLHDLQRVRGLKGDHQAIGAREAGKVMKEYGYSSDMIKEVKAIILTHSCSKKRPTRLEGKILATADAMSHYYNDFYLRIAVTGQRDLKEFKEWVLEKLDRNYNKKIFFASAKKKIKPRHDLYKKAFSMK